MDSKFGKSLGNSIRFRCCSVLPPPPLLHLVAKFIKGEVVAMVVALSFLYSELVLLLNGIFFDKVRLSNETVYRGGAIFPPPSFFSWIQSW